MPADFRPWEGAALGSSKTPWGFRAPGGEGAFCCAASKTANAIGPRIRPFIRSPAEGLERLREFRVVRVAGEKALENLTRSLQVTLPLVNGRNVQERSIVIRRHANAAFETYERLRRLIEPEKNNNKIVQSDGIVGPQLNGALELRPGLGKFVLPREQHAQREMKLRVVRLNSDSGLNSVAGFIELPFPALEHHEILERDKVGGADAKSLLEIASRSVIILLLAENRSQVSQ